MKIKDSKPWKNCIEFTHYSWYTELHYINLDIYHQIFMFWMKERYRLPAVERFIEYMKQQARQDGLQAERETDSKNVLKIYLKDIVNF